MNTQQSTYKEHPLFKKHAERKRQREIERDYTKHPRYKDFVKYKEQKALKEKQEAQRKQFAIDADRARQEQSYKYEPPKSTADKIVDNSPILSHYRDLQMGGLRALTSYGSSLTKLTGADEANEKFDKINDALDTKTGESVSYQAGQMILDPINLTPAGIVSKGEKLAKGTGQVAKFLNSLTKTKKRAVATSTALGAGVGYGASKAHTYGDDSMTQEQKDNADLITAGFVGTLNGIIATATRGKVTGAIPDDFGKATIEQLSDVEAISKNPEAFGLDATQAKELRKEVAMERFIRSVDPKFAREEIVPNQPTAPQQNINFTRPNSYPVPQRLAKQKVTIDPEVQTSSIQPEPQTIEQRFKKVQIDPRYKEAIENARNRSWKDVRNPNKRLAERQIVHENRGGGYENQVIPEVDVPNPEYDFSLTQKDVKAIEKGKLTDDLVQKIEDDLGVLNNHPDWANPNAPKMTPEERAEAERVFAKGGDNLAMGIVAGVEKDEEGSYNFDPVKFIMGLGGYTVAKQLLKHPKIRQGTKEVIAHGLRKFEDSKYNLNPHMAPVKSKAQKEKRGIYNVQNNDKKSTVIYKDAEFADEVIKFEKGKPDYINNEGKKVNGFGAEHITKHLGKSNNGWVSDKELLNIGEAIRNTKPYEKQGKRVYEYFNDDGVRFRVIIGDKQNGERTISFFSNRKAGFGNDSQNYIYNQPLNEDGITLDQPSSHSGSIPQEAEKIKRDENFKKWFKGSKVTDENGEPLVVYHQTSKDAADSIYKTKFDTTKGKARLSDDAVPNGIFFKPTKEDIGVGGDEQMEVFLNIKNPLTVNNRDDLKKIISNYDPRYAELQNIQKNIDGYFSKKLDAVEEKYDKLANKSYDYKRMEYKKGSEGELNKLQEDMEKILKEWGNAQKNIPKESREIIDKYLADNNYDGVIINNDQGSLGRSTKSYIALDPTQIKSIHNKGTFDGNNPNILKANGGHLGTGAVTGTASAYEEAKNNPNASEEDIMNAFLKGFMGGAFLSKGGALALKKSAPKTYAKLKELAMNDTPQGSVNAGMFTAQSHESIAKNLKDMTFRALNNPKSNEKIELGIVKDSTAKKIFDKTGIDVRGSTRTIDSSHIRHVIARHSDPIIEAQRGQIPINENDIAKIPEIVTGFDDVVKSVIRDNSGKLRTRLIFEKSFDDGTTTYIEAINRKNGELSLKTMYKKSRATANPTNVSPVTDPHSTLGGGAGRSLDNSIANQQGKSQDGMRGGFLDTAKKVMIDKDKFKTLESKATQAKGFKDITKTEGVLSEAKRFIREMFTDTYSSQYHKTRDNIHSRIQAKSNDLERLAKVLSSLDEGMDEKLYRHLTGEKVEGLPKQVEELAQQIRYNIDAKGQQAVDMGILSEEAYKEWAGKYLHRVYEPTLNPKGIIRKGFKIDKVHERGKAIETSDIGDATGWLRKQGLLDDSEMMHSDMDALIKHLEAKGVIGNMSDGLLSVKQTPTGKYKFRLDFNEAERTSMGELRKASYSVPETLFKLERMIQHGQFLKNVSELNGAVLADDIAKKMDYREIKDAGFVKLEGKEFGALNGKHVRRDVADDIGAMYTDLVGEHNNFIQAWKSYHSVWKKSKTVWNTTAHVNNFVSNWFLMHLAGMDAPTFAKSIINGTKQMSRYAQLEKLEQKKLLNKLTPQEQVKYLALKKQTQYAQEAKELGVFGRSQLNDILKGIQHKDKKAKSVLGKIDRFTEKMYQGEDDFNRLSMYVTLRDAGKTKEQAKEMVNYMLPDYTKPIPKGWRILRDTGVAPFISWSYYTMPSIVKMLGTKQGAKQATKVIAGISLMEYMLSDGEVTPVDNLPLVKGNKADDAKGRRFVYNKEGNLYDTIKLDRMIPYAELQNPYNFGVSQFSGVTPNAFVNLTMNKDVYSGRDIAYEHKSLKDQMIDVVKHGVKQYAPVPIPTLVGADMIEKRMRDEESYRRARDIQPRTLMQDLAKLGGANTLTYDKRYLHQ